MRAFRICLILVLAAIPATSQHTGAPSAPSPEWITKSLSPNRRYALVGNSKTFQLWLEDRRTHQRRPLLKTELVTLTTTWSPDSTAFVVNDRLGSDCENAYLFDARSLRKIDLRSRIVASDPDAVHFVPGPDIAPHSYVHARRWRQSGSAVEVSLYGHTDGARVAGVFKPGQCFDVHYLISRSGAVRKVSKRMARADAKVCDSIWDSAR